MTAESDVTETPAECYRRIADIRRED